MGRLKSDHLLKEEERVEPRVQEKKGSTRERSIHRRDRKQRRGGLKKMKKGIGVRRKELSPLKEMKLSEGSTIMKESLLLLGTGIREKVPRQKSSFLLWRRRTPSETTLLREEWVLSSWRGGDCRGKNVLYRKRLDPQPRQDIALLH